MKRYDALNAAAPGEAYRNANVGTGDEGSYPNALGFDATMTEIVSAITALGGVPNEADWTQLGARIVAYVAGQIATAANGKVAKAGDIMTGALAIVAAALELTLRHTDNVAANGTGHLLFQRGTGAGATGRIISYGDGANGLDKLSLRLDNAAGVALSEFKFKSGGQLELGAAPTLALEAATKGYVDGVATPDATTSVKGKVQLLDAAGFATGTDAAKALTVSLFTAIMGATGSLLLPSGLIIQWGVLPSIGAGSNTTMTFASTFPTACYGIVAIGTATDLSTDVYMLYNTLTTANVKVGNGGPNGSSGGFYIAMGK
ncbi:MAG: hypothetical protein WAW54_13850 [Parvibaculum sedimenti]|uniref:gp53-like domain-containing protein n=1 Tax=Parvibaculum sedimenti TaxID=2608632 RepID=UPI003BB69C61